MTQRDLHLSILILDNNSNAVDLMLRELRNAGLTLAARSVGAEESFRSALEDPPDVILAAADLPDFAATAALRVLAEMSLNIPLIVMTETMDEEAARDYMELGAVDCLPRNSFARLGPALVRAHLESRLRVEKDAADLNERQLIQRTEDEAQLRESEGRFQAVWQYSNEAMRLTNRDGVIQAVNDAYCQLVGMTREELLGQPFTVVYPDGEDHEALQELHMRRFDEGIPILRGERRAKFLRRDREIDVELFLDRIVVKGGEYLLLTRLRDISERKELEARLLRSQRMECIGALAGGIAHDFNNILAPIFMASSMLRMEMSSTDREKALSTIEESAQRGADVVRRLLLFARGIEGEKKALEPAGLFRELVAIVEQSFPRNIRLVSDVQADLPTLHGDRTQLYQVLLNLCLNARDAMPEGGTLTLGARKVVLGEDNLPASPNARTGSYILARVTDTGIGIQQENLEKIFDPFFSTKAEDAGTGLGLSTSLGIIKSHGGFITVESLPGEGATFDVYIPVSAEEGYGSVIAAEENDWSLPQSRGNRELILVVDDEVLVLDVMSQVLRKCGYRTLLATGGVDALRKLQESGEEIGVIITDLMMPEMDGVQFLRKVRELYPDVPAIAMSGNADQGFRGGLADVGVTEVLDKPFRAHHLLTVIRGAIGQG